MDLLDLCHSLAAVIILKDLSMSLLNNFNHQIYISALPVLFMARNVYLSNLLKLFMGRKVLKYFLTVESTSKFDE